MERLRFLASAALLLTAFLWTNCADAERPAQAPPVRKCLCEGCTCDPCLCTGGECRCATCKDRLQVQQTSGVVPKPQPFGNSEELPVEIIDVWASYCPPCVAMKPDFEAVSREYPGLLKTIDAEANQEWVAAQGVRQIPAILVKQGDKILARYQGRMSRNQIRGIAERWGK